MTMETVSTLMSVALIWGIAAATPGPNFVVTVQTTATYSRRHGFMAVAGIATGTLIWGMAGFFGVSTLFAVAPWLYAALKLAGGMYLIYLGVRLVMASFRPVSQSTPMRVGPSPDGWLAWRQGLLTNLSNPKTAAFVTSLFATTMPAEPAIPLGLMSVGVMTTISLAWYSSVACLFASPLMTGVYARTAKAIDRMAGGLFILFGAKLALDR